MNKNAWLINSVKVIIPYWYLLVTVGLGEIVCCGILGIILYKIIKKNNLLNE